MHSETEFKSRTKLGQAATGKCTIGFYCIGILLLNTAEHPLIMKTHMPLRELVIEFILARICCS